MGGSDDEEEFERDGTLSIPNQDPISPLMRMKNSRPSPIKDDSVILRERGENILNNFSVGIPTPNRTIDRTLDKQDDLNLQSNLKSSR